MSDAKSLTEKALGKNTQYTRELASAKKRSSKRHPLGKSFLDKKFRQNRSRVSAGESRYLLDRAIIAHAKKKEHG